MFVFSVSLSYSCIYRINSILSLPVHIVLLLLNQALSHDEKLRDEDSSRQEKKKINEGKDKSEEVKVRVLFGGGQLN